MHFRSDLSYTEHIRRRTDKAIGLLGILQRLGNSKRGMSPKAIRVLYCGAIRPIFTWGSKLLNRAGTVEIE